MGYWSQNEKGQSFSQSTGREMIWGDQPADIMGKALDEIVSVFERDKRRPPTEDELKAGLLFSLPATKVHPIPGLEREELGR